MQNSRIFKGYGKLILFGEHAVVYGYPALAAGISKGVTCEISDGDAHEFSVNLPQWQLQVKINDEGSIAQALQVIVKALPKTSRSCSLNITLEIPAGAGLGSSAAISVALTRALLAWHKLDWPPEKINELAFKAEHAFHGTPSGIDNTVSTFGGFCYLGDKRFPCPATPVRQLRLNTYTATLLANAVTVSLVVINTQKTRQTKAMVDKVRKLKSKDPFFFDKTMTSIGKLAAEGFLYLKNENHRKFGALLSANHRLLQALGVSCPELDIAASTALAAGAFGAKLTGAGGGGCLIAFAPGKEDDIIKASLQLGFSAFVATINDRW